MRFRKLTSLKVDWSNHLLGFASTLLGIFIAFQLDDWQEEKKQNDQILVTIEAIKKEIERNMSVYKANAGLKDFVEYLKFVRMHNSNGELIVGTKEFSPFKQRFPDRFSGLELIRTLHDTTLVYKSSDIAIDIIPKTGISTNNWEAAKASGILNQMDHSQVATLTEMYDWVTKDLGLNESEFYKRNLLSDEEFTDIDRMTLDYLKVARISEFKFKMISQSYDSMIWNIK